jgi:hypothetical protein
MASIGLIQQLLNGLSDQGDRKILQNCFEEAMKQFRLGDSDKAENAAWFATEFTTHSVANTEFSVEHGMDSAPSRFIPSIRLDIVNSAMVPLTVSRAADGRRAYFKSSVAGATVSGHFE